MPTLEEVATRIAAVNEAVHPHERDETPNAYTRLASLRRRTWGDD